MTWQELALKLAAEKFGTYREIAAEIERVLKVPRTRENIKSFLFKQRKKAKKPTIKTTTKTEDLTIPLLAIQLTKGDVNIEGICKKYNMTKFNLDEQINELRIMGYKIESDGIVLRLQKDILPQDNIIKESWKGEKIIRFALTGDKQFNSKYTQITYLHEFYELCKREGITTVYDTGDIDEGEEMRMGHKYECYTQGADDHVKEIVKNHPRIDGIVTKFITGNHDHSIIKRCGYDIGNAIQNKRNDMIYLGQSSAMVELTPNCTMELRHPTDGTAYAISYKIQKMVDAMQGGEKPNILAVGHYHKMEYISYRNVHCFQTGTFQGQTPWMKGQGIAAHVGGWIVEIHVDSDGTITRCKAEWIPFYNMIKDDYLNWR